MIIKNGHIMDPASGKSYFADIKITDSVIGKIADNIDASDNEEIIDAKGLTVAPGLIDTHVHFRDPGFT